MCLDGVTKRVRPSGQILDAWKVFHADKDGLHFPMYALLSDEDTRAPRGRWLAAKKQRTGDGYVMGFHCFISRVAARAYKPLVEEFGRAVVVKVRVRGVRIYGRQHGGDALVADELFIPKASK